jgi:hypothetical protein
VKINVLEDYPAGAAFDLVAKGLKHQPSLTGLIDHGDLVTQR